MSPTFDILIGHRELTVIQRLGGVLRRAGHRLYLARTGAECADVAVNAGLDLLLLDAAEVGEDVEAMYRSREVLGDPVPPLLAIVPETVDEADTTPSDPRVADFVRAGEETQVLLRRVGGYAELGRLRRQSSSRPVVRGEGPDSRDHGESNRIGRLFEWEAGARREFAGRLHDSTLQELAVAKLHIQVVAADPSSADSAGRLEKAEEAVERSIFELRGLMLDLGPPVFYRCGLEEGLESLAVQASVRWGIRFDYERDEIPNNLPTTSRLLLLQTLWELVRKTVSQPGTLAGRLQLRRLNRALEVRLGFDRDADELVETPEAGWDGVDADVLAERLALIGGLVQLQADDALLTARIVISTSS